MHTDCLYVYVLKQRFFLLSMHTNVEFSLTHWQMHLSSSSSGGRDDDSSNHVSFQKKINTHTYTWCYKRRRLCTYATQYIYTHIRGAVEMKDVTNLPALYLQYFLLFFFFFRLNIISRTQQRVHDKCVNYLYMNAPYTLTHMQQ